MPRAHLLGDGGTRLQADETKTPLGMIQQENARPGTQNWELQKPSRNHEVEGYASQISARVNDRLELYVSTNEARMVRYEVFRLGYYQGLGARRVVAGEQSLVRPQPACPVSPTTGLVECDWDRTFRVAIDPGWLSGYYLVKLVREDGFDAFVPFVVVETEPKAEVLVQASVTTWQAYNLFGGTSLYESQLPEPRSFDGPHAFQVSFDRPFAGLAPLLEIERWLVWWLEQRGYDVAYTTNLELSREPSTLVGRKLFMTNGHDEYWTIQERKILDDAAKVGLSIAFLSANSGYWRIRLDPASDSRPDRVITCYKGNPSDPRKGMADETTRFRDAPNPQPEYQLEGVMYGLNAKIDAFPLTIKNPQHWAFTGTELQPGDSLGNLVGYEWDRVFRAADSPAGLEVLATSQGIATWGVAGESDMVVHYPTAKSFVFAAGTIAFVSGLGRPGFGDHRVGRIVDNVLARAGVNANTPAGPFPAPPPRVRGHARSVKLIAGTGEPGDHDGHASQAQFRFPAGLAAATDGTVYVADAGNDRIRSISAAGQVRTLECRTSAGAPPAKAIPASKCLRTPTGIAIGPDGALYVADTGHNRIRRMTRDGLISDYAGDGIQGRVDGPLLRSRFYAPQGIAFARDGSLYVADSRNDAIRKIVEGHVSTLSTAADYPTGLTVGADGTLYVVASGNGQLRVLHEGSQEVLVNASGNFGNADGSAEVARLRPMYGVVSTQHYVFFSDTGNASVRALDLKNQTVRLLAGEGRPGSSLPPRGAPEFLLPRGMALSGGSLLVADSGNHRVVSIDVTEL